MPVGDVIRGNTSHLPAVLVHDKWRRYRFHVRAVNASDVTRGREDNDAYRFGEPREIVGARCRWRGLTQILRRPHAGKYPGAPV